MQLVIPTVGPDWFEHGQLRSQLTAIRGEAGSTCAVCGEWRWSPSEFGQLSPVLKPERLIGLPVAASPEWFGAGMQTFRQTLFDENLAIRLASASPRDVSFEAVIELTGGAGATEPHRSASGVGNALVSVVPDIFVATLLPREQDQSAPQSREGDAARRAIELLRRSDGLVRANALAGLAETLFAAGDTEHAFNLWRQAAARGSAIAQTRMRALENDM